MANPAKSRYTPPPPKSAKVTPRWAVSSVMTMLFAGALILILNYLEALPGDTKNRYLLLGLSFMVVGFLSLTKVR